MKLPENKIILGDCISVLDSFPANSIDLIFADPPYNLQLQNELHRPNMTKVDAVDDEWDQFVSFKEYDDFTLNWLDSLSKGIKTNSHIMGHRVVS